MAVLPEVRVFFEPVKRLENQLIVVVELLVVDMDVCRKVGGSLWLSQMVLEWALARSRCTDDGLWVK